MAPPLYFLCFCALTLAAGLAPAGDPPKSQIEAPVDVSVEAGSSRAWALMTCSVPFERDGFRHDLLAGALMKDNNSETLRKLFNSQFKVTNHSEAVEFLNKIVAGKGLHGPLDDMFTMARQTKLTADSIKYIQDGNERELMSTLIKYEKREKEEKTGCSRSRASITRACAGSPTERVT